MSCFNKGVGVLNDLETNQINQHRSGWVCDTTSPTSRVRLGILISHVNEHDMTWKMYRSLSGTQISPFPYEFETHKQSEHAYLLKRHLYTLLRPIQLRV